MHAKLPGSTVLPSFRAAADHESPAQLRGSVGSPKKPKKPVQRQVDSGLAGSPRLMAEADRRSALFATSAEPIQRRPNRTGLPDGLKAGVEELAGVSMDDVRVHRASAKPATLDAHAYAQGSNIHLGPGQERHLPHEAWHTVQQKQGRVKPTMQVNGTPVNDAHGLEREADVMGRRALQTKPANPRR